MHEESITTIMLVTYMVKFVNYNPTKLDSCTYGLYWILRVFTNGTTRIQLSQHV